MLLWHILWRARKRSSRLSRLELLLSPCACDGFGRHAPSASMAKLKSSGNKSGGNDRSRRGGEPKAAQSEPCCCPLTPPCARSQKQDVLGGFAALLALRGIPGDGGRQEWLAEGHDLPCCMECTTVYRILQADVIQTAKQSTVSRTG